MGDKEMNEEKKTLSEIIGRIPAVGMGLLLLFLTGCFVIVILASPFETVKWVYVPMIFAVTYACDGLPMFFAWWGVITIGVCFISILTWIGERVKQYIKEVAKEETENE